MTMLEQPFSFENRVTTGQLITIFSILGSTAAFIFKKYIRAEEESEKLADHTRQIIDMQQITAQLTGLQARQGMMIEQMDRRLVRVEDWKERAFRRREHDSH